MIDSVSAGDLHGEVHGRVQPETALVGAKGRVELHTISAVDLNVALVVLPDDSELDHALRDGNDLQANPVFGMLLKERAVLESADEL
jgi:hypothetical protein